MKRYHLFIVMSLIALSIPKFSFGQYGWDETMVFFIERDSGDTIGSYFLPQTDSAIGSNDLPSIENGTIKFYNENGQLLGSTDDSYGVSIINSTRHYYTDNCYADSCSYINLYLEYSCNDGYELSDDGKSCIEQEYNGQIIHNEEDGTITLIYGDDSITIMDKNVGADEVGYGSNTDKKVLGNKYEFGGSIDYNTYEFKKRENNPCDKIGGYLPESELEFNKLLNIWALIRGAHLNDYGDLPVDSVSKFSKDLLIPLEKDQYGGYISLRSNIFKEWHSEYGDDARINGYYLDDTYGIGYGTLFPGNEAYLRCFISEDTKYKITYKSNGEVINTEEIPARVKQEDKQLVRTKNKINESNISTPIRTGYNLTGRKTDSGEYYDFDEIISSNITLNADWEYIGFNITLNPNGGDGETKILSGLSEVPNNPGYQKTGYIFSGWNTESNGEGICYTTESTLEDNLTLYAIWSPINYTIIFSGNADNVIGSQAPINTEYDSGVLAPESSFTRDGYIFIGRNTQTNGSGTGYTLGNILINLSTTVGDTVTLYAQWIQNQVIGDSSRGLSSGGGGKKNSQNNKQHNTATKKINREEDKSNEQKEIKKNKQKENKLDTNIVYNTNYTKEENDAYSFAKSNGITTTDSIDNAKMNTELTRIQMAKMLSNYAINVLGQEPDTEKGVVKFNDVTNKLDKQYDNGVTLAYQLGIMGINMKNNNFRPYDEVTRAEFVTALSRMIYGTKDGTGKTKYYEPHMAKLYNEGIINNTNPKLKEKRGYVMTMLMRTAK